MIILEGRVSIEPVEPREQDNTVEIKVGQQLLSEALCPLDGKLVRITVEVLPHQHWGSGGGWRREKNNFGTQVPN